MPGTEQFLTGPLTRWSQHAEARGSRLTKGRRTQLHGESGLFCGRLPTSPVTPSSPGEETAASFSGLGAALPSLSGDTGCLALFCPLISSFLRGTSTSLPQQKPNNQNTQGGSDWKGAGDGFQDNRAPVRTARSPASLLGLLTGSLPSMPGTKVHRECALHAQDHGNRETRRALFVSLSGRGNTTIPTGQVGTFQNI